MELLGVKLQIMGAVGAQGEKTRNTIAISNASGRLGRVNAVLLC
jgi:hypothetical protein